MKSLFLIPLLLLVTIAPLMAYSQTAGSGGTNTPFVPAEEFNPILTPIDPTPLNSNSTFFDDWCEINESGTNVDAGTWICWYDIEQMYDDIIILWNDEAEVLQVEVDDLKDSMSDMQLELDRLKELTVPDYTKDPIVYDFVGTNISESHRQIYSATFMVQSFHDQAEMYAAYSSGVCTNDNYPSGHTIQIWNTIGIKQYTLNCYWSTDTKGPFGVEFRGELAGQSFP